MNGYRVTLDTGGASCDFVVFDERQGTYTIRKVPSTPVDPSRAVLSGLDMLSRDGVDPSHVTFFCHGTTLATNALLEERGARTGLVITDGFRGVYETMEQSRPSGPSLFDLRYRKPALLAPQRATAEIRERIGPGGQVRTELDHGSVAAAVARLEAQHVQSVAVCLLFAFANPRHEQLVADALRRAHPEWRVTTSSELLPQIREYYRLSTTVINAYVSPVRGSYLERLERDLDALGVTRGRRFTMQSNDGSCPLGSTPEEAVGTILSGPAGGVTAGLALARAAGVGGNVITFDMGGTSCDVALIRDGVEAGFGARHPQLRRRHAGPGRARRLRHPRQAGHRVQRRGRPGVGVRRERRAGRVRVGAVPVLDARHSRTEGGVGMKPEWGSDVMVDAIRALGLPYLSLNPGSSFRGLHDSLVNYAGNAMEMICCPHEEIAVGVAHGYAKASGTPMGVVLHDLVGLLHGAMAIYYAYLDRVPVIVLGGSGPASYDNRRPNIDWIHSANVQGNAVRDFTKWDHEPRAIADVPAALARGYRVAMSEPRGPVYLALDAGLQETPLQAPVPLPDFGRLAVPSAVGPDPAALRHLAASLCAARRPVIVPGHAGRDPRAFGLLTELAELLGAGVDDTGIRLNFPNCHPLCVTGTDAIERADCVLFLDVKDMGKPTQRLDSTARAVTSRLAPGTTVLDIGFNDLGLSSWSEDYAALVETDVQVTADTAVALPLLVEACREVTGAEPAQRREQRHAHADELGAAHLARRASWAAAAQREADASPVAPAQLAAAVWEAVRDHDWVLTAGTAAGWATRLWDFDAPYRHPGRSLGTATQLGISLGVALAHRGSGRLVVDLQPDGDLMFDAGALWIASYYRLPLLVVTFNNRAYFNDWEHQERLARLRGTPVERAHIGMEIDRPAPDFAALARSFDWYAEGPVTDPAAIVPAVRRAADRVLGTGTPALVDVICRHR